MKNEKKHVHQHEENHPVGNQAAYYCPMHCEGDKTYNEPGDCPVCGMHLVPANSDEHATKGNTHHVHRGGGHCC